MGLANRPGGLPDEGQLSATERQLSTTEGQPSSSRPPAVLPPRIVIGAPQGRSGKTTVSLGICAALAARGLVVQPFKKGPDYIDPSWLSEAAGRPCRSLDGFFMPADQDLRRAFLQGVRASQPHLCLIEGNHGLYDSTEPDGHGSTAHSARVLRAPVLLVLNVTRMTRSAAAMVLGYQAFEPETPIAGVILNNVAHGRHEARLREAIEQHCHIPVVGALPRDERLAIPDRHLGLVPRGEDAALLPALAACQAAVERYVDLEAVLQLAAAAPAWPEEALAALAEPDSPTPGAAHSDAPTIGVLRDQAFSFYYPENLEALQEAGAKLVFIDALHDAGLPTLHGLYIGGGFPELFLEPLGANYSLRQAVRQAVEAGLPVYAECGGLMYLSQGIHYNGNYSPMAGVFPFAVEMTARPQGHGYVLARCSGANPFFPPGFELRGHEFHHSRLVDLDPGWPTAFRLERGAGLGGGRDGLVYRNVLASYTHIHASGAPGWAQSLVTQASSYQNSTLKSHG